MELPQTDTEELQEQQQEEQLETPKAKKRWPLVVLGCACAVLALMIILGMLTNWFGFYGPTTKVILGAKRTVLDAGSFYAVFTAQIDEDSVDGALALELDMDKRHLQMYLEATDGNESMEFAIYDGYTISRRDDVYYYNDISDKLDDFFDSYEDRKDEEFSWEEALENISEDLYDELNDYLNFDKLDKCILTYFRKLNSNSWLKENVGYQKKKADGVTKHCFAPDTYDFLQASLGFFEPAFRTKDDYEEVEQYLRDDREFLEDHTYELEFGIKGGKLVSLRYGFEDVYIYDGETYRESQALEMEFQNIGKTTINVSDMQTFLEEAREYMSRQ